MKGMKGGWAKFEKKQSLSVGNSFFKSVLDGNIWNKKKKYKNPPKTKIVFTPQSVNSNVSCSIEYVHVVWVPKCTSRSNEKKECISPMLRLPVVFQRSDSFIPTGFSVCSKKEKRKRLHSTNGALSLVWCSHFMRSTPAPSSSLPFKFCTFCNWKVSLYQFYYHTILSFIPWLIYFWEYIFVPGQDYFIFSSFILFTEMHISYVALTINMPFECQSDCLRNVPWWYWTSL